MSTYSLPPCSLLLNPGEQIGTQLKKRSGELILKSLEGVTNKIDSSHPFNPFMPCFQRSPVRIRTFFPTQALPLYGYTATRLYGHLSSIKLGTT